MKVRLFLAGVYLFTLVAILARAAIDDPTERPIYKSPLGLAIDPSSQIAYVALNTANALAVVDLKSGTVVCEIPVGKKPHDVALFKGLAYVTCEADDTLVAVDTATRKVKFTYKVGQSPRNVSVDPNSGLIQVVCHDEKVLWKRNWLGITWREPIPPQPEGNFARVTNLDLTLSPRNPQQPTVGPQIGSYRQITRPASLFTRGQSILAPQPPAKNPISGPLDPGLSLAPRTAFNPTLDLDPTITGLDLVAHTRPRWFMPTVNAPQGRVFTNAFSFFLNTTSLASFVLLDEPNKGCPDPTDVVLTLPAKKPIALLSPTGKADNHPLKGAKVFISSGGADTVVVLDFHKAAKHAEAHPTTLGMTGMGFGWNGMGFGTMNGGLQFTGGSMMGGISGGPPGGTPVIPGGAPATPGNGGPSNHLNPGIPGGSPPSAQPTPGSPGSPQSPAGGPPLHPRVGVIGTNGGGGFNNSGFGMSGIPPWGGGFNNGGMNFGGQFGGFNGGMMGMAGFGGWMGGFQDDLNASKNYVIAKLPTQANPRRMVLTPDSKTLVVSNYLADSLTLIDADRLKVIKHISLGGPKPDQARRGEIMFHSAKHTIQQQFTCASCHPNHGSDGLSWNTAPNGIGEPLNTRDLHGVRDTGPFGWKGESETLEGRAKNTMREVHKHRLSNDDAAAIAAFVRTLDPPRPLPQNARNASAVARGKEIFHGKANCKNCHRGTALTSHDPRAVILDTQNKLTPFDVPTLRGVGRTAPYLHDGRAATLEDIFLLHNPQKRHGLAHELTRPELSDLVMYLKSL